MNPPGLRLSVAVVLAGIAALMVGFGVVYNLVFVGLALPFVAGAYVIWLDATGRLAERRRARSTVGDRRERVAVDGGRRRRTGGSGERRSVVESRRAARSVLGVDRTADEAAIRRAYRERVKEVHPDADGGSEVAFKRVTDAYERLGGERA